MKKSTLRRCFAALLVFGAVAGGLGGALLVACPGLQPDWEWSQLVPAPVDTSIDDIDAAPSTQPVEDFDWSDATWSERTAHTWEKSRDWTVEKSRDAADWTSEQAGAAADWSREKATQSVDWWQRNNPFAENPAEVPRTTKWQCSFAI